MEYDNDVYTFCEKLYSIRVMGECVCVRTMDIYKIKMILVRESTRETFLMDYDFTKTCNSTESWKVLSDDAILCVVYAEMNNDSYSGIPGWYWCQVLSKQKYVKCESFYEEMLARYIEHHC